MLLQVPAVLSMRLREPASPYAHDDLRVSWQTEVGALKV